MNSETNPRRSRFNSVEIEQVHTNISQEIIEITTDRLKIILTEYLSCAQKSKEWQAPLSVILTIILVLTTANFKTALGLSGDTWAAIFIISLGLSVLWLINVLVAQKKAMTIDDLLKSIKNE